jgi:hypothetical protein
LRKRLPFFASYIHKLLLNIDKLSFIIYALTGIFEFEFLSFLFPLASTSSVNITFYFCKCGICLSVLSIFFYASK